MAHKISGEKCRILICGGTGCLVSGSQEIFDEMSKLAEEYNKQGLRNILSCLVRLSILGENAILQLQQNHLYVVADRRASCRERV